ncbi:hypothetical protein BD414DRAFT_490354 [Trametes punicea]|nr:hypothetical protein BD414DRAFT_490354 [Trametes punicea]
MATTRPAPSPSMHLPRTSRHYARGHEASSTSGEPRVRSILLSGSSKSAYPRNGDQLAAPDPTLTSDRSQRASRRTKPSASASQGDGVPAAPQIGTSSSSGADPDPRPASAEARPSSSASASASIHLEEDLAATPASSPRPEHSTSVDASTTPATTMPHARPRMSLELPPPGRVDVLYDSDHKLTLEGTSPKPCIIPGNALHLIDDDPDAPRSQTPPSVIIIADESDHAFEQRGSIATDGDGDPETSGGDRESSQLPARPTGPRVRFRSRVRITSGVHRHRHSTTTNGTPTPCSSASDSPSSSISAPLRYQSDEHGTWGPLGKRLSAYAAGGWPRRASVPQTPRAQVEQRTGGLVGGQVRGAKGVRLYDERTPLIRPDRRRIYTEPDRGEEAQTRDDHLTPEERALRTAALRREEEAVFGKWPWRIFNRHWWWWHVEPVLCCCCSDDSDYEEL